MKHTETSERREKVVSQGPGYKHTTISNVIKKNVTISDSGTSEDEEIKVETKVIKVQRKPNMITSIITKLFTAYAKKYQVCFRRILKVNEQFLFLQYKKYKSAIQFLSQIVDKKLPIMFDSFSRIKSFQKKEHKKSVARIMFLLSKKFNKVIDEKFLNEQIKFLVLKNNIKNPSLLRMISDSEINIQNDDYGKEGKIYKLEKLLQIYCAIELFCPIDIYFYKIKQVLNRNFMINLRICLRLRVEYRREKCCNKLDQFFAKKNRQNLIYGFSKIRGQRAKNKALFFYLHKLFTVKTDRNKHYTLMKLSTYLSASQTLPHVLAHIFRSKMGRAFLMLYYIPRGGHLNTINFGNFNETISLHPPLDQPLLENALSQYSDNQSSYGSNKQPQALKKKLTETLPKPNENTNNLNNSVNLRARYDDKRASSFHRKINPNHSNDKRKASLFETKSLKNDNPRSFPGPDLKIHSINSKRQEKFQHEMNQNSDSHGENHYGSYQELQMFSESLPMKSEKHIKPSMSLKNIDETEIKRELHKALLPKKVKKFAMLLNRLFFREGFDQIKRAATEKENKIMKLKLYFSFLEKFMRGKRSLMKSLFFEKMKTLAKSKDENLYMKGVKKLCSSLKVMKEKRMKRFFEIINVRMIVLEIIPIDDLTAKLEQESGNILLNGASGFDLRKSRDQFNSISDIFLDRYNNVLAPTARKLTLINEKNYKEKTKRKNEFVVKGLQTEKISIYK